MAQLANGGTVKDSYTAFGVNGLALQDFSDGSKAICVDDHAMNLTPSQADDLRRYSAAFGAKHGARSILDEARAIIHGDRERTHGEPSKNLEAIASMWRPIFGVGVTPQQVILAMVALKVARAVNQPGHRDHWTDIVGYCALAERVGYIQAAE
jgi:hypothetical protein